MCSTRMSIRSARAYYRESRDKLADCVQQFNQMELAFVVDLGDLIDRDFGSFREVLPIYNRLKWPHHHVLGNHDFSVEADRIDEVPGRIGLPHRYYAFHHQSWRFIVLDGNDISLFGRPHDSTEYREAEQMYESLRRRRSPGGKPGMGQSVANKSNGFSGSSTKPHSSKNGSSSSATIQSTPTMCTICGTARNYSTCLITTRASSPI